MLNPKLNEPTIGFRQQRVNMTYSFSVKSKASAFRWLPVFILVILLLFLYLCGQGSRKEDILFAGVLVVTSILTVPQLYLFLEYSQVSDYREIEVDLVERTFLIQARDGSILKKPFSDIKSMKFYKPKVPLWSASLMLYLCKGFYYYKVEFEDECYYITSLLYPRPVLDEKDFYEVFIEIETTYARIR